MNINRVNHLFHLVNRSGRAFIISVGLFFFLSGLVFFFIDLQVLLFKGDLSLIGLYIILKNFKRWHYEVITEGAFSGYHTIIVQSGLKVGFILFLISEIMLFFGFFWSFFHVTLCPDTVFGMVWPPISILVIDPLQIPLFNTLLLLLSGFSLTWVHRAMVSNLSKDIFDGFLITIFFGWLFLILQLLEYYESLYSFNDSVYGCTFYILTGLHGIHVFIGVNFITIIFVRFLHGQLTPMHHLGFLFAAWYWHFVDIVWILLFLVIYIWGGGVGIEVTNSFLIEKLLVI